MTTYATFTEDNEAEGETWRFYVPIEGNEEALAELQGIVGGLGDQEVYQLNFVPLDETQVDTLVAYGGGDGYMPGHTKLSGRLTIPRPGDGSPTDVFYDWFDTLYKGGIAGWMTT